MTGKPDWMGEKFIRSVGKPRVRKRRKEGSKEAWERSEERRTIVERLHGQGLINSEILKNLENMGYLAYRSTVSRDLIKLDLVANPYEARKNGKA